MWGGRKRWITIAAVSLLICGALYAFHDSILAAMAKALVQEDPLEKADAIFVLSGDFPSRSMEAATLYKEGYAPLVILSHDEEEPAFALLRKEGVGRDVAPTRNDLNHSLLLKMGVPPEKLIDTPTLNIRTETEAENVISLVQKIGGIRKLLVVTSATHTKRSGEIMRKAFKGTGIEIRMRATRYEPVHYDRWWKENLQRRVIGHEWLAMFAAPFLRN